VIVTGSARTAPSLRPTGTRHPHAQHSPRHALSPHHHPTRGGNTSAFTSRSTSAASAGSGLVLACDVRIASERARFGDIFIRRGIAGGAYLLTRAVGPARALELIYTGDIIDAREAHRLGIFNRVVPAEALEAETMALARRLAAGPAQAMALSKAAVEQVLNLGLDEGLRVEEAAKLQSLKSAEVREGIMAFVDKRNATFPAS
jgi:2-(1,2-epoxy-1,2-dihydrophenyl)acetyl-CoA isomerase